MTRDSVAMGPVEDVVADRDVSLSAPHHDLSAPIGIVGRKSVVGNQDIAKSVRELDRPSGVDVGEDIVDHGKVVATEIKAVVQIAGSAHASDVMEDIAVDHEVMAARVGVHTVQPVAAGTDASCNVLNPVASQNNVMGRVIAVNALLVATPDDEVLNHDVGGVAEVDVRIADHLAI